MFACFFQVLKARVNNEVMHFNSYLQDVARMCADDYNFISQGAMQYSEVLILHQLHLSLALCGLVHKQWNTNPNCFFFVVFKEFLRSCLECIRTLPQFYQIHELTSLTGGTFDPGLALTFEKQLLNMVMYICSRFSVSAVSDYSRVYNLVVQKLKCLFFSLFKIFFIITLIPSQLQVLNCRISFFAVD